MKVEIRRPGADTTQRRQHGSQYWVAHVESEKRAVVGVGRKRETAIRACRKATKAAGLA